MARPVSTTRSQERGFALLFIFALAGIAAIMLYIEMPRAVFESQRAKEDLLVMRGQEYQRGLQLYYRKYRKYPQTLEELEKSAGMRFLRRRYVDPMTGKDEWRLIHVVNGQYTDSKVIKPPAAPGTKQDTSTTTQATDPNAAMDPNDPAARRRASDVGASEIGTATGMAGDPNAPPPIPNMGVTPGAMQGVAGMRPGVTGYPGRTMGTSPASPGATGAPSYNYGVGASIQPSTPVGGVPPISNQPANSQYGGVPQTQPGQTGMTADQINPALNLIQNILTTPRQPPPGVNLQGSTAGVNTNPSGTFTGTFGTATPVAGGGGAAGLTGIAGVASKKEGKGIKLINEKDRIELWEFIYDPAKDRGGKTNVNAQTQNPNGLQNGMQNGMQNPAQGTGFGNSSGFGSQSGFGQQGPRRP